MKRKSQNTTDDQLNLPGFVDIIFLLLIFSMATMSFTSGQETPPSPGTERFLPMVPKSQSESPDLYLRNLLVIIGFSNPESFSTDTPDSSREVVVLVPDTPGESTQTIQRALLQAKMEGGMVQPLPPAEEFLALTDEEFAQLPACRLIAEQIDRYAASLYTQQPGNTIEIRAVKETEFRLINFILTKACRDDNMIPRIVLHTLSGS
ncbi:hypothetical protein JXO52_14095 [bacterium]|nr:hypothetical protein [bacterium]